VSIYLIDHPPAIRQFRCPRRATPSGVVVVHTAESTPDQVAPDIGAENVAAFIARRTTYGSYHHIVDSDSRIQLVPFDCEAFHDATGSNPHSYGVSAATQAAKWSSMSATWRIATVRNMARAAADYAVWVKTKHGVVIPAKRVTRAQSEARQPGFISHAERDPARRTDPGADFPWAQFLADFATFMAPAQPVVDLSQLQAAARLDPARPQGGTTAGSADDVRIVEAALVKAGLLSPAYAGDGSYGSLTVKAYAAWQRHLGYTGSDADGIPGLTSLTRLGARYGFKVTP